MADTMFEAVFDWFTAHQGQTVVVETGCSDPRPEEPADFPVVRVFTTLGEPYMVPDPEREVGVLRVSFFDNDIERGGVQVEPECLKSAQILGDVLQVWQHDVYFSIRPYRGA